MAELKFVLLGITGCEDEIDDVVSYLRVNEDVVDQFPRFADRIKRRDGVNVQIWRGRGHTVEDGSLIVFAWVANFEFEHKAIYLSLG